MVKFKEGTYKLNKQSNFDYQLNRAIMWDGGRLEDVQKIASNIVDSETWKSNLIKIGDEAYKEHRIENAIAYYRMSEFFMYDGDPDKKKYYKLATDMFYDYYSEYFSKGIVKRINVPYEGINLPVMYAKAVGNCKDVILLHGGNDSYFEELFFPMLYLSESGYDVYLFEGPGQGGVMRSQNKHFTYKWEKPVKSILDYFNLNDVTIVGASLGGMLAPRAAAFDKRIKRVVAWSILPNFLDVLIGTQPKFLQNTVRFLLKIKCSPIINFVLRKKAKKDELIKWGLNHGMYAYEAKTPYEYLVKMNNYQIINIGDKIDQDMLIIGANQDHFINYRSIGKEINCLTNVKSLTVKIFTEKQNAAAHCNVGNAKLVFDTIMNWIEEIKK
ncbi:MAG: alpha/beta fold hydrolase [Clostridia bacterium]|nr:alpha/beta fold hydrolase [Clostridia bacterium]